MTVSVKNFVTLVENQVAAVQGYCRTLIDFTIGSILRALVESNAGQGLFLQAQALQVAALTRAATCGGADLDSFYADFDFERLGATVSNGQIAFARFTATQQALLPAGAVVQSFDGSQQFTVQADSTNNFYNATLDAYVAPAGTASITVSSTANLAGAAGNVAAGTITQIVTSGLPFDTVTNPTPFVGGADAESDPAYRARFVLYLASLSKATRAAILYAVNQLQIGISQYPVESQATDGTTRYGYFYDVVDDGTGNPPASLITAASLAVDATRAFGIGFGVIAPTIQSANVSGSLGIAAGYVRAACAVQANDAIAAYLPTLPLGATLSYFRLAQIILDASPGINDLTGLLLNGGTGDLAATPQQRIVAGTLAVA